jgi:hypothetical protein
MKTIKWLALSALFLGVLFTACKKDEDTQLTQAETQQMIVASEDQTVSEDFYEDVDYQVDWAIETRDGGGTGLPDCPVVTIEPADGSYPRTITIDFGDGCNGGLDGRFRKGQIIINQSAAFHVEGAVRVATLQDYFVDDAHIEGTRTWVNEGFDAQGNVTFSRTVEGGKITFPDGSQSTWQSNYTLMQVEGGGTPLILLDNVFETTGSGSGVNRNGKAYTVEITSPLVKKRICVWIVAGAIELTVDGKTVSLDYGNGICDNKATLTLPNGTQHEILVRRWW